MAVHKFTEYINYLSGFVINGNTLNDLSATRWQPDSSIPAITVWHEIAKLPLGTLEISQVPVKREEGWICLTATGLNIIGRIGHKLFTNAELEKNWKQCAAKMGDPKIIDWRRVAEIWGGNIIQGNKLLTQQVPVRRAYDRVAQALGLTSPSIPVQQSIDAGNAKEFKNG